MSDDPRRRQIRKHVSFTQSEWDMVAGRMEMSGARRFDAWAREALMGAQIRVVKMPFDPQMLRSELSRLGNNVNQIARQVNTDEAATMDEVRQVRKVMQEVQSVIDRAVREGRRG